jgi:hypothetical protein
VLGIKVLFKAIVGSIMTCLLLTIPAWLLQRLTEIPFASHRLEAMIVLAAYIFFGGNANSSLCGSLNSWLLSKDHSGNIRKRKKALKSDAAS